MKNGLTSLAIAAILLLTAPSSWAQEEGATFPYPDIPQTLLTPQERMAYLLEHYWDGYDFADTALIENPEITEQGFVNFCDLLPRLDSASAVRGVEAFSSRAFSSAAPDTVAHKFARLAEHYLFDPESPMRSDELFLLFLDRMEKADAFTPAEQGRYAYLRSNVGKNMPGTVAADFDYWARKGGGATLLTTDAELLMIYFNDPECEVCHGVTKELSADSLFTDNPHLKVLAVYPDEDTALWLRERQPFPPSWIDACSPGGEISANQLYFIRATPTIYLLDSEKRVILKDPDIRLLRWWLSSYSASAARESE